MAGRLRQRGFLRIVELNAPNTDIAVALSDQITTTAWQRTQIGSEPVDTALSNRGGRG